MSQQQEMEFWTKALNIPGFRVLHERRDTPNDPVRFTIAPVDDVACCPRCGLSCNTVHRRHRSRPYRDLPLASLAVVLLLSLPQFHCLPCRRFFTPDYAPFAPGAHATERFLEHIARLIDFSDIRNVALLYHVPERTLSRWYYDYLRRLKDRSESLPLKPITKLGIDELSVKKNTVSSLL